MTWQVASLALLAVVVTGGIAWYDRSRPPARVLALVAALAALAVVGRLAFAAIPNVKPTTDIVLFAGYALGAVPGFAVGTVTALVSNVFLSQGPWTVWQMAGWGAVGAAGALLARAMRAREPSRMVLACACGVAGLAFGAWMDVYVWTYAARQDLESYLAVSASSLPYNLAHAIGNVVFCLLIGPMFVRSLRRYRRRFEVRWPAPAGAAAAALGALALAGVAVDAAAASGRPATAPAATAAASTPSGRAAGYLLRAQNRDGGFGAARGQASSPLYSGWAALGLAAAGRNPRDVRRPGGRSIVAYVRGRPIRDVGELERTILVLAAAGASPRRFGGRDLVAALESRRRADGSIAGYVSYTAFGVLALRAAGAPAGGRSLDWLERSQGEDGGFGVTRSSTSDTDMTGAVLQALAAAGRGGGGPARRAAAYLRAAQNRDGGFGQLEGRTSNAQSTAYAIQGLHAVRSSGRAVRRAIRYLVRLQGPGGTIAYSRTSRQTPVWVTAQALAALRRAPLPIAAVPRKRVAGAAPARERAGGGSARRSRAGGGGRSPAGAAERAPAGAGGRGAGGPAGGRGRAGGVSGPLPDRVLDGMSRPRTVRASGASGPRARRPAGAGVSQSADDGAPAALLVGAGLASLTLLVAAGRRRRRRGSHRRHHRPSSSPG